MTARAGIYARTSPDCRLSADQQIEHLKAVAAERGWAVEQVFTDRPSTVRKGVDRRPGEAALLAAMRSGSINRVMLWSIDRVGRSLVELVGFLETCRMAGVAIWIEEQAIDTPASKGMSLLDLGEMMALHLRQGRRDRILRGQAAARSLAIRFGRPPIPMAKVDRVRREFAAGRGVREAARLAGVSAASASRIKVAMDSATPMA
jgi:DNA invertase Pin-like site-specific DNA recombinase